MIAIALVATGLGLLRWMMDFTWDKLIFAIVFCITIVGALPFAIAYRFRQRSDGFQQGHLVRGTEPENEGKVGEGR